MDEVMMMVVKVQENKQTKKKKKLKMKILHAVTEADIASTSSSHRHLSSHASGVADSTQHALLQTTQL